MNASKSHSAALKLINDIALVDLDLAAKIKPSIDMFVESLESTFSNNALFTQLTEFFKLTDDNAKKQWLISHPNVAEEINKLFDSMNEQPKALNEEKEENTIVLTDVPIKSTEKKSDEETEISTKIPEDGFANNEITAPLRIKGDDKKLMGKTEKDLPTEKEMDPNNTPKVKDGTKTQEELKVPSLPNGNTTVASESAKRIYKKYLDKNNLNAYIVKESIDNRYAEFLDKLQLDNATTALETDVPQRIAFKPIRWFATKLYNEFEDEFDSYATALEAAKAWYDENGRKRRNLSKIEPSRIYVELRKTGKSDFTIDIYLIKPVSTVNDLYRQLSAYDSDLKDDIIEFLFGDNAEVKSDWREIPHNFRTDFGPAHGWILTIPFSKENSKYALGRVKHEIVNFVHNDHTYNDKYIPTTRIPAWIYSTTFIKDSVDTKLNEDLETSILSKYNEDRITILYEIFYILFNKFLGNVNPTHKNPWFSRKDVIEFILDNLENEIEIYCKQHMILQELKEYIFDIDYKDVNEILVDFLSEVDDRLNIFV